MNRQDHFIRSRLVVQGLVLIPKPKQFLLAVSLANIHAQIDKGRVYLIVHSVRRCLVTGTLNGDCPLVILSAGRTPRTVLFLHAEGNPTIKTDTIVATCLPGRVDETSANTFCGKLTHYAMRRNAVNGI